MSMRTVGPTRNSLFHMWLGISILKVPPVQVPTSVLTASTVLSPNSPTSPMASLTDIKNLIDQMEARMEVMEARMNEALAAQRIALIAELGNGNGNGNGHATSNQGPGAASASSNPNLNLDDMPSRI
ncbi:hypothetical protein JCGZ_20323 [Jatropha curcas]|uniref:Uncharacterized protein n=1 Tax=Jatropha curcas TaxID=180498 RepID=A0A067K5L7_JATCU|nr:hypothetical protein JCGZ_20323 [Jatropha curcas]